MTNDSLSSYNPPPSSSSSSSSSSTSSSTSSHRFNPVPQSLALQPQKISKHQNSSKSSSLPPLGPPVSELVPYVYIPPAQSMNANPSVPRRTIVIDLTSPPPSVLKPAIVPSFSFSSSSTTPLLSNNVPSSSTNNFPSSSTTPSASFSDPFGPSQWQSPKRILPDRIQCSWRIKEKESVYDTDGPIRCQRSFMTAELLAKHVFQDHIQGQTGLRHTWQASKLSNDGLKQACQWGNCLNRMYHIHRLKQHVVQAHFEAQMGLKYACPYYDCPNVQSITSELALQHHILRCHRDDGDDLLREIFQTTRMPKLEQPPPLPSIVGPALRMEAQDTPIRAAYSKPGTAVISFPSEEVWSILKLRAARKATILQPGDQGYLTPWTRFNQRLDYHQHYFAQLAQADEAIDRAFEYSPQDLLHPKRMRVDFIDIPQDPLQAQIESAIARSQPYTVAQLSNTTSVQVLLTEKTDKCVQVIGPSSSRQLDLEQDDDEVRLLLAPTLFPPTEPRKSDVEEDVRGRGPTRDLAAINPVPDILASNNLKLAVAEPLQRNVNGIQRAISNPALPPMVPTSDLADHGLASSDFDEEYYDSDIVCEVMIPGVVPSDQLGVKRPTPSQPTRTPRPALPSSPPAKGENEDNGSDDDVQIVSISFSQK